MKEHILQFFKYEHLPAHLRVVSAPFCELARALADEEHGLPRNPERTVALRKLLEAKDAAVRAEVAEETADTVTECPQSNPAEFSRQLASDDELEATEAVCAEAGIGIHRSLVARIIARLRAAEKSRT